MEFLVTVSLLVERIVTDLTSLLKERAADQRGLRTMSHSSNRSNTSSRKRGRGGAVISMEWEAKAVTRCCTKLSSSGKLVDADNKELGPP